MPETAAGRQDFSSKMRKISSGTRSAAASKVSAVTAAAVLQHHVDASTPCSHSVDAECRYLGATGADRG